MTSSSVLRRTLYGVLAGVVLVGFGVQFYLLFTGGADVNSGESGTTVPVGTRFVRLFGFFTVDSNLLVLFVAALIAFRRESRSPVWSSLFLATLLSISVTGTAFSLLLDPTIELRGEATFVNTIFHMVSPAVFAVLWLLWGPRKQITWRVVGLAFLWPLAWLAYTFIRGALTGWYPYLILDAGRVGWGSAILNALLVIAYALVLTLIVVAVDRWVPAIGIRAPAPDAREVAERA